jgi:PAS domain S-box-containing protein
MWLRVNAVPLRGADDAVDQVLVSFTDVSIERRRADEAQAAQVTSELRYAAVLRAMSEGVAVHDPTGAIAFSNPSAERILGLSGQQLRGLEGIDPRWSLVTPEGVPLRPEQVPSEITRATGQACRSVLLGVHRANGTRAWLAVSTDPIAGANDASQGVVATFSDITAQRSAQVELERAHERLTGVTSSMPGVIYQFLVRDDGTTAFPFVAGTTLELLGLSADQMTKDASAAWAAIHPDDVANVRARIGQCTAELSPFEADLRVGIGKEWRWARARSTPTRVEEGVLFTGVVVDITEERMLAERLQRAQRREIMGDLAAGVAHNFNNMLAAVLPNLEAVREQGGSPTAMSALDDAIEATTRAADLVRQLIYVARGDYEGQAEPVEIRPIVDEVARLCRRSFDSAIAIDVDIATKDGATTFGRGSQVHQVVLNLCLNARDALLGREAPRVSIVLADRDGPVPGHAEGDSHIVLTVRDTGCGMDEATLRRVGEPFFTTKPPGRGTGLGIASVMATVRDLSGHLEVTSELGKGTTFVIHFPRYIGRERVSGQSVVAAGEGIARVLLVDDERLVRRAVERMLSKFCRTIVTAADGIEALEILEAENGKFDVVLVDLSMPRASGNDVLARVLARWPTLPVVIMSGNTSDRTGLDGAAEVIDKPLSAGPLQASLLRAVGRR